MDKNYIISQFIYRTFEENKLLLLENICYAATIATVSYTELQAGHKPDVSKLLINLKVFW